MADSFKLRDGSVTTDSRLGRIPRWDARNEQFRARALLTPTQLTTPRSYTWALGVRLDQGYEGSCVGHGIAHELAARPAVVDGVTTQFAREHIYWEAQRLDDWEGGSFPGALPFYEGTSVLAGMKAAQNLGFFDGYHWALDLNEAIITIGYKGPLVIGVDWYEGMMGTDSSGFISPTGSIVGGHCVVIRGVSISKKYFLGTNSWGPSWGVNGDFKMTYDTFQKLQSEFGEVAIPTGRHRLDIATI